MRHNKLTEIRENAGMTQKELAEAVGVSQQSIYYYEHGDRDPRASMLKKLADALGCSISDILDIHVPSSVTYKVVDFSDPREREIADTIKHLSALMDEINRRFAVGTYEDIAQAVMPRLKKALGMK